MPVTTAAAAVHITPVVLKTFLDHAKRKSKRLKNWQTGSQAPEDAATEDLFYDEGFHIVQAFLNFATHNTVESLQSFANTRIPSPYWAAVSPVHIPLSSCNKAADTLISWFGEDIKTVVGGERWWQVRGLDGIDAEWITERGYLSKTYPPACKGMSSTDADILRMSDLDAVMFYIHGGGYYFGSINTHRYQILRYARKFKGRAFAVNYRKAPQYPFPCAIQDVLAAYLYLIDPPKDALHKPVPASKIVLAGDSAGGGLCVNLLIILRDMGLELPAGAVLISPWVDMTHSFPSVMDNVATDIIPPNGFMAKPSTLWPVSGREDRVGTTTTNAPPQPGHADTLKPDPERLANQQQAFQRGEAEDAIPQNEVQTQHEMQSNHDHHDGEASLPSEHDTPSVPQVPKDASSAFSAPMSASGHKPLQGETELSAADVGADTKGSREQRVHGTDDDLDASTWEPKPPKVLMDDPNATPLELRDQIQLYATNEQLTHPACSPILQASLGNLCPLYIIAGNGESLRDEIVYLAHRCAAPEKYQPRAGVMKGNKRQLENAQKWTTPTKVHLQVFDDMCHVLTVFLYTDAAKYAYRSIAQFIMHVTSHDAEHVARNPFPELHFPRAPIPPEGDADSPNGGEGGDPGGQDKASALSRPAAPQANEGQDEDITRYRINENVTAREAHKDSDAVDQVPEGMRVEVNPTNSQDIANILFIRERVDIYGNLRAMEPAEEIAALQMNPSQIGLIKEAPVRRWSNGQAEWDRLYAQAKAKVPGQRKSNKAKALKMLQDARDQGLHLEDDTIIQRIPSKASHVSEARSTQSGTEIQSDRRWGPLDLAGECVPPSAICKRRDTPEALALLKKSIFWTAPVTHRTIPRSKFSTRVRAALDPNDRVAKAPKQSASEEQQSSRPMHGLQMWSGIVGYFMNQSTMQVEKHKKQVTHAAGHIIHPSSRNSSSHRHMSTRTP